jgi:tetraacyldisaccharide 4'-kinase
MWQQRFIDLIEGKKKDPLLQGICLGISQLFRAAVAIRNFSYSFGLLSNKSASVPVISVGNISVGGTGKTPFVQFLCKQLSHYRLGVLSRGYRSQSEHLARPLQVNLSTGDASLFGDEPYWLASTLPHAQIFVGKNRIHAAQMAAHQKAQVIILDDGMQYRQLKRDIEIVLVHASDPLGKGFFLPRGWLRDSPKRLNNADYIVVNGVRDEEHLQEIKKALSKYYTGSLIGVAYKPQHGQEQFNQKAAAFCAIAHPERFLQSLQGCKAQIVDSLIGMDHQPFSRGQLELFSKAAKAKGANYLICTEKDAIKLPANLGLEIPVKILKMEMIVTAGKSCWQELLHRIEKIILK